MAIRYMFPRQPSLMPDTGRRLSETAYLREADAHLEDHYVKVVGKGSKERIMYVLNKSGWARRRRAHNRKYRILNQRVNPPILNRRTTLISRWLFDDVGKKEDSYGCTATIQAGPV